ncbi:MAG: patatin-like phospholipase family protein [Deltaproteobacteria bacterium]|nr:patatin-like phospholipase family protein [Deltaproteobacteria bacterium]
MPPGSTVVSPPATALVLSGAVAKGAFQAGVLEQIASARIPIARIVAASAGAMNGAAFAAGVRYGRIDLAADVIIETWLRDATWLRFLRPSLVGLLRGGVSSTRAVADVVLDGLARIAPTSPLPAPVADIALQMVVAPLLGTSSARGSEMAIEGDTTFEYVTGFEGAAFDSDEGRRRLVTAVTASAAFPLLFAPVEIEGLGPCVDGGAVNNAPVSVGLDSPEVTRVIVVTDSPRRVRDDEPPRGLDIVGRLAEMLVNERLFRDLAQSRKANEKLARIEGLADKWGLSPEQRAELVAALGWRAVELVQIRPERPLDGTAFSGLHDRDLRARYIDQGREAAARVLERL